MKNTIYLTLLQLLIIVLITLPHPKEEGEIVNGGFGEVDKISYIENVLRD